MGRADISVTTPPQGRGQAALSGWSPNQTSLSCDNLLFSLPSFREPRVALDLSTPPNMNLCSKQVGVRKAPEAATSEQGRGPGLRVPSS